MTAFQEQYPIPSSQMKTIPSAFLQRPGVGGWGMGNDPEKCNWTNYWLGTHCNKKGTITTAQPKHGPCYGAWTFSTTLATTVKPSLWLFQYSNSLPHYLTPPLATAVGSGHTEHWSALCPCDPTFYQWPLLGSEMIELTLFHGNFFLSISLQVMTHIKTSLQCQVLLLFSIFLFLKPLTKP